MPGSATGADVMKEITLGLFGKLERNEQEVDCRESRQGRAGQSIYVLLRPVASVLN